MELKSFLISAYEDKVKPKRLVVTGEKDPEALAAIQKARAKGWIEPVFCGSTFVGGMMEGMENISTSLGPSQARHRAFKFASSGEADALMYTGPIDEEFFKLLSNSGREHRSDRILSYINVFLAPRDSHLTLLTDTLINASPSLRHKIAIIENAVAAAHSLGVKEPLIAAVAPLELINPALPSTLDAAVVSKMSQRGQFGSAVIEGPLGMDNAESASAAFHKGISSPVPGNVDIYFFPDLESASLTAQFISWSGRCSMGGILGGSDFPVILRSPLEAGSSWLINILLGVLL